MNKKLITIILINLFASIVFADDEPVIATYKGGEVKPSQIMQQFKQFLEMQPASQGKKFQELESSLQEMLARAYINLEISKQEARNLKIDSSPEFQEKLKHIETQLLLEELIGRKVKAVITDDLIAQEYKKFADNLKGQEEIEISHVLVASEAEAKEIKKKLTAKGAKFANIVKEFSKDESSKANGGKIGYVTKGNLVPEFEKVAFAMKVNEISEPVKTQFGWHIIKLTGRRPAQVPSFEQAKQDIQTKLAIEVRENYMKELNDKADVKINLPIKTENNTDTKK